MRQWQWVKMAWGPQIQETLILQAFCQPLPGFLFIGVLRARDAINRRTWRSLADALTEAAGKAAVRVRHLSPAARRAPWEWRA